LIWTRDILPQLSNNNSQLFTKIRISIQKLCKNHKPLSSSLSTFYSWLSSISHQLNEDSIALKSFLTFLEPLVEFGLIGFQTINFYGQLLPLLLQTHVILKDLQNQPQNPDEMIEIGQIILSSFEQRFSSFLNFTNDNHKNNNKSLILATISHPLYKLKGWKIPHEKQDEMKSLFIQSVGPEYSQECVAYLNASPVSDSNDISQHLDYFPTVKNIFIKYNSIPKLSSSCLMFPKNYEDNDETQQKQYEMMTLLKFNNDRT
jgi:hypothetical protein